MLSSTPSGLAQAPNNMAVKLPSKKNKVKILDLADSNDGMAWGSGLLQLLVT